ncbi:hypothetical protein H1R20_g15677, partial [Candolleomyces eurysporus]
MIIFRVTTGRSFTKFPTVKDGVLSNTLQFAHKTAEESFLQSTYNSEFGRDRDLDTEKGNTHGGGLGRQSTTHVSQEMRDDSGDLATVK